MSYSGMESNGKQMAEFLGITEDLLPCIRILEPANDYKKYKMDDDSEITS